MIAIGLAALLAGASVYLTQRSGANVYFLPDAWQPVFSPSALGQHLPSFMHVFGFAILTAVVLGPWRGVVGVSCLFWAVINVLFELGQIDAYALRIARLTPAWTGEWPVLENIDGFFLNGTFDPVDIASALLGAMTAYLVLGFDRRRRSYEC